MDRQVHLREIERCWERFFEKSDPADRAKQETTLINTMRSQNSQMDAIRNKLHKACQESSNTEIQVHSMAPGPSGCKRTVFVKNEGYGGPSGKFRGLKKNVPQKHKFQRELLPGERVVSRFTVRKVGEDEFLKSVSASHQEASSGKAKPATENLAKDQKRAKTRKSEGSSGSSEKNTQKEKIIPKKSGLQPEGVPGERVASRFIVTKVNEDVLLKAAPESHKKASSGQAQQEKEKLVKDLNRAIIVKKSVGSSGSTGKRKEKKKHITKMSDQQAGVLEADDVSKLTVRKPEETEENVLLKADPPSQNEASSDETQPEMEKLLKKPNQESISIAIEELPEPNVLVNSPESDEDHNTHATRITKWKKIKKLNKFIPKKMATYIVLLYSFITGIAVGLSVITNYVSLNKDFWIDVIYGCELLVSSVTGSLLSTVTMDNVKPAKTMTVASVISTIGLSVQMYGPMATFQHVGLLITGFGLGFGSFTSFFWIKGKPITIIFCIINILLFMTTGLLASYYANLGFSILCFCDVILTILVKWYTTELKKARNGQRPTHREDATEV